MHKIDNVVASKLTAAQRRIIRQQQRAEKRQAKSAGYQAAGLNGKRAVARRLRQIEVGQMQVSA